MRTLALSLELPLIRLLILSVLLLGILLSPVHLEEEEAPPKAFINLEKKEALIGDPIKAEIVVEGPHGAKIHWPNFKVLLPEVSVSQTEIDTEKVGKDRVRERCTFIITPYKVGTIDLPPFSIPYEYLENQGAVETAPEQIKDQSVLEGKNDALADIKRPVKIPFDVWPIVKWLLFALIIIAAGAMLIYWIRRRQAREKIIPAEDVFKGFPPQEWAYRELDQLLGQRLLEKGHCKEFYIAFSEILKRYLEGRYRIETLERTTLEIQENLARAKVDRKSAREALSILEDCDFVKFAKYVPTDEQSKEIIQQFYSFIDKTKPQDIIVEERKEIVRS